MCIRDRGSSTHRTSSIRTRAPTAPAASTCSGTSRRGTPISWRCCGRTCSPAPRRRRRRAREGDPVSAGARGTEGVTTPQFELRSGASWRDPFPMYAALREHDPVHHVAKGDFWVLTRFDDVWAAAGDPGTFSSASGLTVAYDE